MKTKYGTYYGKPLEEYSKEELMQIIVDMEKVRQRGIEQHLKDIEFLASF